MFHRDISEAVQHVFHESIPGSSLRILDLGCGDASMVLPILSSQGISSYIGCDLSQPALDIARKQLETLSIKHRLVCEDMCSVISDLPDASVDMVFSSYAAHHLHTTQKQHLIAEISRVLTSAGSFILIDIFREPNETRADYMTNYMTKLNAHWIGLSAEEKKLVIDHATEFDFPEQADFYQNLCHKYGLPTEQRVAKHTWHEAWIFSKSNHA